MRLSSCVDPTYLCVHLVTHSNCSSALVRKLRTPRHPQFYLWSKHVLSLPRVTQPAQAVKNVTLAAHLPSQPYVLRCGTHCLLPESRVFKSHAQLGAYRYSGLLEHCFSFWLLVGQRDIMFEGTIRVVLLSPLRPCQVVSRALPGCL